MSDSTYKSSQSKWYQNNKEKAKRDSYAWRKNNLEKVKASNAKGELRRSHGITPADKERILLEQDCRCAICETDDPGSSGWFIDHDHSQTEKSLLRIRGILCFKCNTSLGMNGDTLESIEDTFYKQRDYLLRYKLKVAGLIKPL